MSNAFPIASSAVVARMRNAVGAVARRSSVCPPETRSVRNGYEGHDEGAEVRKGVSAWACCGETRTSAGTWIGFDIRRHEDLSKL